MLGRAIRLNSNKWANRLRIIGSCLAVGCFLLLAAGDNLIAQPKKKPVATPRKTGPQDEKGAEESVSKASRKSRKKKDREKNSVVGMANFSSPNFLLHTDLSDEKAEELLDRLETMLELISKYWSRPSAGEIEMFVVKDLNAWRWALCHLLANNTNYALRFRPLGLALLTHQPGASFEQTYGDMAREISFEYRQFLENVDTGYRADLCSWDWKAKFKFVKSGAVAQVKIDSGKGWQPSKLILTEGEEYEYSVAGNWNVSKDGSAVDADGDKRGRGKLIGVLLSDENKNYALGEPFELGTFGSVAAPGSGSLYLRCRDDWAALADNHGAVTVKMKLKSKGPALSPPKSNDDRQKTAAKTKSDDKQNPNENSVEETP